MCVAGPARPRAVVVGAGPVGALAALHLERGGYAVTVFEQRPAAVREGRRSRPAYSIVLNERGLAAMSPFPGLREGVAKRAVPITGTCAHLAAGKVRVKLGGPFAGSLSIARDDLVSTLVDYGRAHNISYRLDTAVADVDFDARSLRASGVCVDADGDAGTAQRFESVGYELCVLAEGVYAGR
jgi:kynurenine 3-monooxygenase